jgi:hypothetical protein
LATLVAALQAGRQSDERTRISGLLQGFLATEAFITAKGNRAVKNPILWGQVVRQFRSALCAYLLILSSRAPVWMFAHR